MVQHIPQNLTPRTILRRKQVEAATGYGRSMIYLRMAQGLFIQRVSLGAHSVGWPAHEVDAINAARIAGKSDDEIRALVQRLHSARTAAVAEMPARQGR